MCVRESAHWHMHDCGGQMCQMPLKLELQGAAHKLLRMGAGN